MAATSTSSHSLTGSPSSALFPHLSRPASMTSDHVHPAAVTVTSGTNDNNNSSSGNSVPNPDSSSPNLYKVIIRKDERGFGLKVSGSHPVFVAHVSDGGPAARAGVRVGDKIIRVNGTCVNATDHNQVVQMIKGNGDIHVALDLIPAPQPAAPAAVPAAVAAPVERPVIPQKPANVAGDELSVPGTVNRSASPSAAARRSASAINYYRPGNHQPMIPIHLSESSGVKRGLSLVVGQATAGDSAQLQQQTSPISQSFCQPDITSPVPAPKTAQRECEKKKETVFKSFIKLEKERLKELMASNTQGNADEEIEKTQANIEQWSKKLKEIQKKRRSRHKLISKNIFSPSSAMSSSQTHLLFGSEGFGSKDVSESTDDLSSSHMHGIHNSASSAYPVHLFWSKSTAGPSSQPQREGKESRKSHSFKDELLLKSKDQQILSMESDDECDDDEDAEAEHEDELDESDGGIRGPRFPNLNSKRRVRKRSKEVMDVDEELKDIQILIQELIACKKRYLQSATGCATRSAKEKITGRRKGPSAVRSSFMSSSSTPEEIEWTRESRKLLTLISFALNQRKDINYLLFFGLGSLVQNELIEALDDACKKSGKGKGESLFELISLFLVPDCSPLSLKEISPSMIELDSLRNLSDTSQDGHLLRDYLTLARDSVNRLLIHSMNQTKLMGLLPSVTNLVSTSPSSSTTVKDKNKLKEAMRKLLSDALSFEPPNPSGAFGGDFNQTSPQSADFNLFPSSKVLVSHLKQLIQGAPLKGDATDAIPYSQSLARVVSLLSLFYHLLPHSIFFSSPPAELESFIMMNSIISSRPGAASDGSGPSGPRHKSLPSSLGACSTASSSQPQSVLGSRTIMDSGELHTHPASRSASSATAAGKKNSKSASSSAISTYTHNHVMTNPTFSVLSEVIWCSSCGHLLWGKTMFSLNCMRCNLRCHSWCFFTSVHGNVDHPCVPLTMTPPALVSGLGMIGSPTTGMPLAGPALGLPLSLASAKPAEGRRSFFVTDPSKFFSFKTNQSKLSFASDLGKMSSDTLSSSTFYHVSDESSSSSLDLSSSSSSSSEDEEANEEEYVSASSDPSTPILGSAKHGRRGKNIKKTKRSKSLEEGVSSSNMESAAESKSKEFEQALEEEEKEKRLEKEKRRKKLKQRKLKLSELISTEKSFGNKLHLLDIRFYEPIVRAANLVTKNLLTKEEIASIFSNHRQLIDIHVSFYKQLKDKIKPILMSKRSKIDWKHVGEQLREIFLSIGKQLEEEVAYFCANATAAQELLRAKSKSYKFNSFLAEAESTPDLERLKFKDLLAAPIQRIMRYPLLVNEVLNTFPTPSQMMVVDPIDSGKTDVNKQQLLVRELEGRESIESALVVIKCIVQGVNRRKTEFEFLSWFRQKIAPFYPKAGSLTLDSIRLLHEGSVNWKISRPTAVTSYLLLLKDLLLILTVDQPNTSSAVLSSSSSTLSLAPPPAPSSSSSPSAVASNSSSAAFTFSFISEKLRAAEAATNSVYILKIPSAPDNDKQPGVTVNPVLEITPDLETRPTATIRTAFFLFSKGFSSSSSTVSSGHKSKDVEAKAAMYELITPSDKEREEWEGKIRELALAKNEDRAPGLSRESSISSFQRNVSTNPFHSSWSQEQEQEQISRNRNRPLPPLPISTSVTSGFVAHDKKKSQKMSSMKRSKSQDGSKTNLSENTTTDSSTKPPAPSSHSREPSDSDLPPIVGLIERMPAREPLNNFSEAVSVTGPPDVRYAQRITVRGSHYANDVIWNSENCTDNSQQAYEEVDTFDESRMQENVINQKILTLLDERRKLLSSKSVRPATTESGRAASPDLLGLGLDAFRLELLTQNSTRHANTDRKENEMNDLRVKLIHLLTLK